MPTEIYEWSMSSWSNDGSLALPQDTVKTTAENKTTKDERGAYKVGYS